MVEVFNVFYVFRALRPLLTRTIHNRRAKKKMGPFRGEIILHFFPDPRYGQPNRKTKKKSRCCHWSFCGDFEAPTVCMLLLLLLFLTFSALVANPKKLLYTVANPARGLLNREKKKKKKSGSAPPPPPPARCSFGEKKKKKKKKKN